MAHRYVGNQLNDLEHEGRRLQRDDGHTSLIHPSWASLRAILAHFNCRLGVSVIADAEGTPPFTCVGNRAIGRRITPRGVRFTVDGYLTRT